MVFRIGPGWGRNQGRCMIVTCPNCETKFDIPDDKYRPGRKARCSNCGFVFALPRISEAAVPPPTATGSGAAGDPFNGIAAENLPPDGSGDEDSFPEAEIREPGEMEDAPAPPASPASLDDAVFEAKEKKAARKSKKNLLIILGVAFVLALLGYGGYKVYAAFFLPSGIPDPAEGTGGLVSDADKEKEAARLAATRRLSLSSLQQYIERGNKRTGPIIVIAGSVTNNFDTPKSYVLLEITLFDNKGRPLVVREQYGGVTLQPLQLQTLSREALESALNNRVTIEINNVDIQPGDSVPFMALFFGYPDAAYEFEIKIVGVQDSVPAG